MPAAIPWAKTGSREAPPKRSGAGYPFGETRFTTGTMQTDKLFTGQRDTGLGIYYFNARFYSPKLGRFLSADTIAPSYTDPQDLNRFSYVLNNPLRYIDPTGHNWEDCGNRSGYRCRIHMNHVGRARARWAAEAAVQQQHAAQQAATLAAQNSAAQQAAAQFAQTEFMNSSVSSGNSNNPSLSFMGGDNITHRSRDDDATLPFSQTTASSGPNWGKVAQGVGILVALSLVVVPIGIGVIEQPELLVGLVEPPFHFWPLLAGIGYVAEVGINDIVEGIQGK